MANNRVSLNPGIDHIVLNAGEFEFDELTPAVNISIPTSDRRQLLELYLSIQTKHSWPKVSLQSRTLGPRIFFPSKISIAVSVHTPSGLLTEDITGSHIKFVREQLLQGDGASVLRTYREAAANFQMQLRQVLVGAEAIQPTALDKADSGLSAVDIHQLSEMLASIGDETSGYFGTLNPYNYLGTGLEVAPAPIISTLTSPLLIEALSNSSSVKLTFTNHPTGLFSGGGCVFHLIGVYYNRLLPEFVDLENVIKRLLMDIRHRVGTGSQLLGFASSARDGMMETTQIVQDSTAQIQDNRLQVEALKNEIAQLKKSIALLAADVAKKSTS